MTMDPEVTSWLTRQVPVSEAGIAACVSATHLLKERSGFGQRVVPAAGSVLASPTTDTESGEPDYFFHWLRDAALIMDAARPLVLAGTGTWRDVFRDYVRFSLSLGALDGRTLVEDDGWRAAVQPDFAVFLRTPEDLATIHDTAIPGEVRFGADGTLDPILWSRPQHDGAALEALVCLRYLTNGVRADGVEALIRRSLDDALRHHASAGYDIWEETPDAHFYTGLVQYAAFHAGAAWARRSGDADAAARYEAAAGPLGRRLGGHWSSRADSYVSPTIVRGRRKELDSANLLALLHAGLEEGEFAVTHDRALATLERLETVFAAYPLNRRRPPGHGIVLGRYEGDVYGTAGPWYICTFAAAELRYRRAAAVADPAEAAALLAAGDATMAAAMATVPPSGVLTEQFDPETGAQSSARDLGWSHAALLTAAAARKRAIDRIG